MRFCGFLTGLFLLGLCFPAASQCTAIDFTIPVSACQNERISPVTTESAELYEWDFCSGDLNNEPTAKVAAQLPNVTGRPGLELVEKGGIWFGFVTGTWANNLQYMEFGNGLDSDPTSIFDLGNLGGRLNAPGQIRMILQDQIWYGIIHNTATREILKVTFGNNFSEVISVSVLTTGVGYVNSGLAVGNDPVHGWLGVISEPDNTFSVIRFGNDLQASAPEDVLVTPAVPNSNNLGDVDLINICGKWFGAAVNFGGGNTYLLDFGYNLFSIPKIDQMASLPISNGGRLRFAKEGEDYFLLIASLDGIWHKLTFGSGLHISPDVVDEGTMAGQLPLNIYGMAAVKVNSTWTILTVSQANGLLLRVNYPQNCSASQDYSADASPGIRYAEQGTYNISLNLFSDGMWHTKSKSVSVSGYEAPDIDFIIDNICAANEITFTPLNISADIIKYDWNFGDLSVSDGSRPIHRYTSAAEYHVDLHVTSGNGCVNHASKNIHIYPEPESSFTAPNALLCTNNEIRFINGTNDVYDGNLSYEWFIDDVLISSSRDLEISFETTDARLIKLVSSIPGCAHEMAITMPTLEVGPVADFSFTGTCQDDVFTFQPQISDAVETFLWNFGDGSSTGENASWEFSSFGAHAVSLIVTNTIGCETSVSKTITVHPNPVVSFNITGPPNACAGVATRVQNETATPDAAEITEWLWTFDDDPYGAKPQTVREPEHVFQTPGTHLVSLTATTAAGCASDMQKHVFIFESPSTDFAYSSACDDVPVVFTIPADAGITGVYWEIGTSYYNESAPTHTFRSAGDYPLYLEVTGANGCIARVNKTIHVPARLNPNFSVSKNCVNQAAIFTDITTGIDPVMSSEWTMNGNEIFNGSPLVYTFMQEGSHDVRMKVTTEAGCTYEVMRQVPVYVPPDASFLPDKVTGAYPLEVEFTNTSVRATHFRWEFHDETGATSIVTSPRYTFLEEGAFDVVLTAFNDQECEDTFGVGITTMAPRPNAEVELITLGENPDGSIKLIVTIHNQGNTILHDVPLDVDFSGILSLRQMLEDPVLPGAKYNIVLNTGILSIETLHYLCVDLDVDNDLSPAGNRICRKFGDQILAFPSYPNPASSTLNLEWISAVKGTVRISFTDAAGRTILQQQPRAEVGLNHLSIDLQGLERGFYYLLIQEGDKTTRQRIVLSH